MANAWQMVVAKGEFPHPSGITQVIDDAAISAMAAAFDPARKLLIDFDHYSDLTPEQLAAIKAAKVQLPSEAAGWITALAAKPDGLFAQMDLTPEAQGDVKDEVFRFISPVFPVANLEMIDATHARPLVLSKVALTNEPNITAIPALTNAAQPVTVTGAMVLLNRTPVDFPATTLETKKDTTKMDYKAELLKLLGLLPDSTDQQITDAIAADIAEDAAATEAMAANKAAAANAAEIKTMCNRIAAIEAELPKIKSATLPNRADGNAPTITPTVTPQLTGIARTAAAFAKK